MDWNSGYVSTFRLYSVNQSTWGDGDEIKGLVSASITKDSSSGLVEDASITIDGNSINGYVRLVMEAKSESGNARCSMGTFLVTSPKRSINGTRVTLDLECYSVLKPASDKLMPIGWYLPKGSDPIAAAFELLSACLQCPIDYVESDLTTESLIVAESNETYLSMANYLISTTNWFIDIDGTGKVSIKEMPNEIEHTFDTFDNDVLFPELTDETDIFSIPNVLRVTDSYGNSEVVRNDDENSISSTYNVGWEKWSEASFDYSNNDTLLGYANEMLEDLSKSTRKISYTREFNPDVNINDVATFLLPQQGIIGNFRIISQSIEMNAGAKVKEIAILESYTWRS